MPMRYLSQNSIDFVDLALGSISDESWVFVLAKRYNKHAAHHFRIRKSNLHEFLSKIELQQWSNYYISASGFMGGKSRTKNKLYSLNNIVIDIDCHRKLNSPGLLDIRLQHLVHYILHDGVDEYNLLPPSMVVYSGRGIQLWWCHESLSAKSNQKTWERTGKTILQIVQQILADNKKTRDPMDSFGGLSVDPSASFSPTGVYRIPGTMNISANREASYQVFSEHRYTLQELKDFNRAHQKKENRQYFVKKHTEDCSIWAEKMLSAIRYLREIRDNQIGEETRNNFCFVYYCMLKSAGFDREKVEAELAAFNSEFKKPMRSNELKSTLSSAMRKDYKISSNAMIKILGITNDEETLLNQNYGFNRTKTKKTAIPKKERYDEAVSLYESGKYTIKTLAQKTRISEPTLRKVLRQAGVYDPEGNQRDRYAEIRHLRNHCGKSAASIAQELNCSLRTVWRALKTESQTEREASSEELFQNTKPCHERKKCCNNGYHYSGGATIDHNSEDTQGAAAHNRSALRLGMPVLPHLLLSLPPPVCPAV